MGQLHAPLINIGGLNSLQIAAVDNPPPGFPHSRYDITGFNTVYNSAAASGGGMPAHFTRLPVIFHTGPKAFDMPLNGVTEEALLAVVIDRLEGLQDTPEACMENQMAKEYIVAAFNMLQQRQPAQHYAFNAVNGVLARSAAMAL